MATSNTEQTTGTTTGTVTPTTTAPRVTPKSRVDRAPGAVDSVTGVGSAGLGTASGLAQGKTVIDDGVIAKVAGIAAREVPGVFALGGNAARAFGAIRSAIGGNDLSQGVHVEVGETQVAVDVTIVVEYPTPMQQVADQVRSSIADAIENLVGMEVAEINVAINDVHIPGDDSDAQVDESRVA